LASRLIGTEWCEDLSKKGVILDADLLADPRCPAARAGRPGAIPDSLCATLELSHTARLGSSRWQPAARLQTFKNAQKTGPKAPAFYLTATLELQGGRRLESSGRRGVLTA
jgi:hypothetical protein